MGKSALADRATADHLPATHLAGGHAERDYVRLVLSGLSITG